MDNCRHDNIQPDFNLAKGWDTPDRLMGFECMTCNKRWTVDEVEQALRLSEMVMASVNRYGVATVR